MKCMVWKPSLNLVRNLMSEPKTKADDMLAAVAKRIIDEQTELEKALPLPKSKFGKRRLAQRPNYSSKPTVEMLRLVREADSRPRRTQTRNRAPDCGWGTSNPNLREPRSNPASGTTPNTKTQSTTHSTIWLTAEWSSASGLRPVGAARKFTG
jgi:hypothetical protein